MHPFTSQRLIHCHVADEASQVMLGKKSGCGMGRELYWAEMVRETLFFKVAFLAVGQARKAFGSEQSRGGVTVCVR